MERSGGMDWSASNAMSCLQGLWRVFAEEPARGHPEFLGEFEHGPRRHSLYPATRFILGNHGLGEISSPGQLGLTHPP